ncbi:RAC serine/threonine-protein kinase-like [Photinus pyralis]|nr:RAC serine/threonine-protein kinase-like [Photinus pyralis]
MQCQRELKGAIMRDGWVWKKGEHIRNWRLRYFVLMDNGLFLGFKKIGDSHVNQNAFNVKGCHISVADGVKQFKFTIRCLQGSSFIERTFYVETESERQEWVSALQSFSSNLDAIHDTPFNSKRVTLADFEYLQVLGRGTFGKVMLCKDKSTEKLYAMKIIKKEAIATKNQQNRTLTENKILKSINHPFLASLKYSFQTSHHVCFVMDFVQGGEIFFHLRQRTTFSENEARFYGAEITSALSYLHSLNIVFRDIKSENLLLDRSGHIKLVDFGLCKDNLDQDERTKSFCGTPEYMAPEVIRRCAYGRSVDWWSLGIVMYEMMCGELPFYHSNYNNLFSLILIKKPKIPSRLSKNARDLLTSLLQKNPVQRLGTGKGAQEVKKHPFFDEINWLHLEERKIPPPFVPQIEDETDTRYFDLDTASDATSLTPPSSVANFDDEMLFRRFSFRDKRD